MAVGGVVWASGRDFAGGVVDWARGRGSVLGAWLSERGSGLGPAWLGVGGVASRKWAWLGSGGVALRPLRLSEHRGVAGRCGRGLVEGGVVRISGVAIVWWAWPLAGAWPQ